MAFSTEPLIRPSAGDYQRIGLRTTEFRPLVIRRALERSAHPLALMHLRSPNEEVERLLLGVMVSAYRVLDPRRREDAHSRIMLGRLHPQLADEAVQLAQTRVTAPLSAPVSATPLPATGESGDAAIAMEPRALAAGGDNPIEVEGTPGAGTPGASAYGSVGRAAASRKSPPHPTLSPADLAARGGGEGTVEAGIGKPEFSGDGSVRRGLASGELHRPAVSAPPIEVQLITTERFLDTGRVPGWDQALSSPDLLVQAASKRAYRAIRRHLAGASTPSIIAAAVLAASVLIVGTWRTAAWLSSTGEQLPATHVAGAAPPPHSALTPTDPAGRGVREGATEAHPTLSPTDLAAPSGGEGASDAAADEMLAGAISIDPRAGKPRPPENSGQVEQTSSTAYSSAAAAPPGSSLSPVDFSHPLLSPTDVPARAGGEGAVKVHPVLGPINLAGDLTGPGGSEEADGLAGSGADAELELMVKLPAVPPEAQQAAARLHVETLVRNRRNDAAVTDSDNPLAANAAGLGAGSLGEPLGAARQIAVLRSVASESREGSAERWVALVLAGQVAMLAGRVEDAQRAITDVTQVFDIGFDEATVKLARWAASDVVNERQRQDVATWIDQTVRSYVLDGELAVASLLVGVAHDLGVKHRDESIKAQSKLWRDSLAVAQRYAEAAEGLRSSDDEKVDAGQASAEERGLAGRYWALVRRDWHRALPYLAAGNNAKLAHYAGIELLAGAALDAQDAITLAEGYLGEAKRAKGWLGDSYVLHAHELLLAAAPAASETKALELARAAEKLKGEHARAFSESVVSRSKRVAQNSVPVDGSPPIGTVPAGLPAAGGFVQPGEAGMLGRLTIAGQDVGALVRYEPGMTVGTKLIDQIATQLNLSLLKTSPVEWEFVGMIRIDRPTTISLSLLPLSDGATQKIAINGQPLSPDSAAPSGTFQRYDVDLLRGDYLLRWTASPAAEDRLSLRVTAQSSGAVLKVIPPPATMPGHPARLPTVLQVGLVAGE